MTTGRVSFCRNLWAAGRVQKIGISVYEPEAALEALNHPRVDVVQIPSSIFDRRFITAGVFEIAKTLKKELHVRSVFLQGRVVHVSQLTSRAFFEITSCTYCIFAMLHGCWLHAIAGRTVLDAIPPP